MFGKQVVHDLITRSTETEADRRVFLKTAGVAGLGVLGAGAVTAATAGSASADAATDAAVLNFALNLEYLEAEFYLQAAYGRSLKIRDTLGKGKHGAVSGGHKVPFQTRAIRNYAREIANDEESHVKFLRAALGGAAVARPQIDVKASFKALGKLIGVDNFDPYGDEDSFLLGAFIFEDVGVTAYKGAAPLISNKAYLEAAAGILAVEAYHAGIVRTSLYAKGIYDAPTKISNLRDSLDGPLNKDKGIGNKFSSTLVPTDRNAIAFSRDTGAVLNIVYGNPNKVSKGLFFPRGTNGAITTSANNNKK